MAEVEKTDLADAKNDLSVSNIESTGYDLKGMIYVVRNQQVMIDSDLAMLYQVETKALNRAVKRNINRFPEDFCFQLTKEEDKILKCQIGTSKILDAERTDGRGGRRTLPYVFTEQGISMLASVLHSEVEFLIVPVVVVDHCSCGIIRHQNTSYTAEVLIHMNMRSNP